MRDTNNEYVQCLWEIADIEDELHNTDLEDEEREKLKKRLKELQREKSLLKNLKNYNRQR